MILKRRGRSSTPGRLRIAAVVVLALAGGACGQADTSAPTTAAADPAAADEIALEGLAFDPERVTIEAGTTVTWTNDDSVAHTVTSGVAGEEGVPGVSKGRPDRADDIFDGDLDAAGATFAFTFDEPGTYEYFCRIHGGMTGTVVVE
jgi:plastocyanin